MDGGRVRGGGGDRDTAGRGRTAQIIPMARENVRSRLLIAALLLWVAFLTYETAVRSWDLYRRAPNVDLPGHFLAGMATCALLYWLARRLGARAPQWRAVWWTLATALLWEATEAAQERFFPDVSWLRDYFWWDGFFDVIASTVGSFAVFPLLRWLRDRSAAFRPMDI